MYFFRFLFWQVDIVSKLNRRFDVGPLRSLRSLALVYRVAPLACSDSKATTLPVLFGNASYQIWRIFCMECVFRIDSFVVKHLPILYVFHNH